MTDSITTSIIGMVIIWHLVACTISQFLPPSAYQNPSIPGPMSAPIIAPMMMSSPMQMPPGYPQQRLPVMVMPFHSKAADKKYVRRKKRRPKKVFADYDSTSNSDSESCSSSSEYLRTPKHRKKKRQVLTPVISYVTRNGRVVFQKKIKKENAGDWLEIGKKRIPRLVEEEKTSSEMTIRDLKQKYGIKYRRHSHDD